MNVKISDIKVGDKILVKQQKRNKLPILYKSEPFTVIEKKGNTLKIRDAYGNERIQNVADVRCFWEGEREGLIPCIRCQSARGETRLATISSTRQVLAT